MSDIILTIHKRIKEQRLKHNFTLAELAEMLDVKEATVQRYESGEIKNLKHDTIIKLANIFKCSPSYLMGWEEEPTNEPLTPWQFKFLHELQGLTEEQKQEVFNFVKFKKAQNNQD